MPSSGEPPAPVQANHCCLCGLMCAAGVSIDSSVEFSWPHGAGERTNLRESSRQLESSLCIKRLQWLRDMQLARAQDASSDKSSLSPESGVQQLVEILRRAERVLLWVDSADVATMRAVVHLAQRLRAVIRVGCEGKSLGTELVKRIAVSEGWLGTTMAEIATRASLLITLGNRLTTASPLVLRRLLNDNETEFDQGGKTWIHIGDSQPEENGVARNAAAWFKWPKAQWYSRLTNILLHLSSPSGLQSALEPDEQELLEQLKQSQHTTLVWDADEFDCEADELTIRRLLAIARQCSTTATCSLLAIDNCPGSVTAEDVLLWMTGCRSTAIFDGDHWVSPMQKMNGQNVRDPSPFDTVVFIRALPTTHPLPETIVDFAIVPQCELTRLSGPPAAWDGRTAGISSAGWESSGLVFRGDQAMALPVGPIEPNSSMQSGDLPLSAARLLEQVMQSLAERDALAVTTDTTATSGSQFPC